MSFSHVNSVNNATMASTTQATNRPRAPLTELPLRHFVTQSLACSPKSSPEKLLKTPSRSRSRSPSLPRSRCSSVPVSPHKQALLQSHRIVREGSVASPSNTHTSAASERDDNMPETELSVLPRRLFGDRPPKHASSDISLEASPILPCYASIASRFSPHKLRNLAYHSTSRPSTPKGATTTPLNARQHRPPHTSGLKPTEYVEPSPTTQRMSEPRLLASRRQEHANAPTTPSRNRKEAPLLATKLLDDPHVPAGAANSSSRGVTPFEEPTRSMTNTALQSLPKKKHRVSRTEIAIAHEEAGAGPIASPSPRKMVDYFSPAKEDAPVFALAQTRFLSDSISDRQQSLAALRNLTVSNSKQPVDGLMLTKSGLFLGVVAGPMPGWSVFEDPIPSSDTAPSQDHAPVDASPTASPISSSINSPAGQSTPSTPNKENRIPDINFLASKAVPAPFPERAHSVDVVSTKTRSSSRIASAAPSPATAVSRKRGTGGRLSLLADAEDDDAHEDASLQLRDEGITAVHGSGKKPKSRAASTNASPVHGARKASHRQRKVSAGSGRTSHKGSATHHTENMQRQVDPAALDAVALRTRSRTRA